MSTRLMRGEEEAGRYDLLLAGQTTRRRAAGQALVGLGAGVLGLFALTALGAIVTGRSLSAGFSLGQCLYFAVTLVAAAAMFLAVGALASQLAGTRRRAAAMAGVVFGLAYTLPMVADTNQGLLWLAWLSPSRPRERTCWRWKTKTSRALINFGTRFTANSTTLPTPRKTKRKRPKTWCSGHRRRDIRK